MECSNPLCYFKGTKYKSQRGLNCHLCNSRSCYTHYMNLYNNTITNKKRKVIKNVNNDINLFFLTDFFIDKNQSHTELDYDDNNKRLNHNNTNINISESMQILLTESYYNSEDNDNNNHEDDSYSIASYSTLSSNDEFLNDDQLLQNDQILGKIFTRDQRCIINLIKLLEDMNCPDSAVEKIIDWARESYNAGFDFKPSSKTRHGNLQWMKKMVVNNNAFYHQSIPVVLNEQTTIDVIAFDFTSQLLRLLQNKRLMTQENLLIDTQNPSAMYTSPNNILSEALSGYAYRDIYIREHQNHTSDRPLLVVPICLLGDATHIDTAGRFKLEPWSFSQSIFKEKVRRNNQFWGMLGYIKHLKSKKLKKGESHKMCHKQLSAILASLINSTETLQDVAISFDNKTICRYDISCPVLYVIADTEGADKICGRYACHNVGKVQRHCRMCDVDSDNLDNPTYICTYLKFSDMHQIALHGTQDERKQYSQHDIVNAFHAVNFGGQKNGLLSATPPDILHVVRKGIVEWSVKSVLDNLTDDPKDKLDKLAIEFKKIIGNNIAIHFQKHLLHQDLHI